MKLIDKEIDFLMVMLKNHNQQVTNSSLRREFDDPGLDDIVNLFLEHKIIFKKKYGLVVPLIV